MTVQQLRIYTIPQSKRDAFFDRWDSTARPLMESYGFRIANTWTGEVDPTSATVPVRLARAILFLQRPRRATGRGGVFEFGYELEWDDLAQLRSGWAAFLQDSRWVDAKARSRKSLGGEPVVMVSDRILTPRP